MVREVFDPVFRLIDLELHNIIAEIVDNSLDQSATEIDVWFDIPDQNPRQCIVSIVDNGNGFESPEQLFNCLEIATIEGKISDPFDIGMYRIGMKTAPLNKFFRVDIFAHIEGTTYHVSFFEPMRSNLHYNLDDENHLNPTLPLPYGPELEIPSSVRNVFSNRTEQRDWSTIVIMSQPWKDQLLEDSFTVKENLIDNDYYQKNLKVFLGMTYERYLLNNESLRINIDGEKIEPVDPFWKDFTPRSLNDFTEGKNSEDAKSLRYLSKFGTLEGYRFVSTLIPGVTITPYVIPEEKSRGLLRKYLPNGQPQNKSVPFPSSKPDRGGTFLESSNTAGFYFYRDNRLITYGRFYDLGQITFDAHTIRIEVNYDSSVADSHFEVAPNKSRMDSLSDLLKQEIFRALKQECGGPEYASPFNASAPFFVKEIMGLPSKKRNGVFTPETRAHYPNVRARGGRNYVQYSKCDLCELIHEPGDRCPKQPCETCRRVDTCLTSCTFMCLTCQAVGDHLPTECPLICRDCGKTHSVGDCPAPQESNCPQCGEVGCGGTCASLVNERSTIRMAQSQAGARITLNLFKNERERCIQLIRSALEELEIDYTELLDSGD